MEAKMAVILDDITGPPAVQQPMTCTSSCKAYHRPSTKGEFFSKNCNVTKCKGGIHQPPPQTTVGV